MIFIQNQIELCMSVGTHMCGGVCVCVRVMCVCVSIKVIIVFKFDAFTLMLP